MHGSTSDYLSYSLMSVGGELEGGSFSLVVLKLPKATAVAIEATGRIRGDQLCIREIEFTENVTLLS